MQRIYLTKDEKKVFLDIIEQEQHPPGTIEQLGMPYERYLAAVLGLDDKGLLYTTFNYGDVVSVNVTPLGKAYIVANSKLTNPLPCIKASSHNRYHNWHYRCGTGCSLN